MAWGMLLKGAAKGLTRKAAVGAGKKMAGKMLGRGKKKQPQQQQQPPSDGGGGDVGGAIVPAGSSAIIPTGVKSSALAISQTSAGGGGGQDLEGTVLRIKTSVIKVENLLAGSAALQEKQREDQRKAREAAEASAREGKLEKPKDKKQKFSIPAPKVVKSFWEKMKAFFLNTLLGIITVKLLPFIDKLTPVLKLLGGIGDWALKIAGWAFNVLVTAIDLAYGLYDKARKWVGNTFGEDGLKWFDKLSDVAKNLINGFLIWKLVGERIFKAAVGAIKGAWNLARNIGKGIVNIGKNIGKGIGRIMNPKRTAEALKRLNKIKKIKKAKELAKLQKAQKIKNIGKLRRVAKVKGVATKGVGMVAKGAGKVGGFAAKIFGKAAGVIAPAFKAAKPFASKFFSRVPIVGPLIVGIISLLSGEGAGKAIFKTLGAALGGFLGGALAGALAVGTAGLGALVAPALVILGETLGVFLGDLLHNLIMGGGLQAAGKKIGNMVKGIFDKILDVKDWIVGGFGRFFTGFMEEHSFKLPGWVSGTIKKLTGMELEKLPNVLQLYNPLAMFPLLKKSFFPPGGDKGARTKDAGTKDSGTKNQVTKETLKQKRENLMKKLGYEYGELTGESDYKYYIKGNQVSEEKIKAVSKEASYEDETVVLPPIKIKEGDGEKTSAKALFITSGVLYAHKGGDDPYEKLYVGGLG